MSTIVLKRRILPVLFALLLVASSSFGDAAVSGTDQTGGSSSAILSKYLEATQTHDEALRGASMEVDIEASVPSLKERGRLHALRKISKVGQVTYKFLGFQGDNTVKNQIIGRWLQAEQQSQGDQGFAITPANYKFKFKGERAAGPAKKVYVFQLSPRKKKVGLFKGEIWLDAQTCLPVFETGRFVKNPSIFLTKIVFARAFRIQNGLAVPQYTFSTMDARLIGRIELNISYSKFSQPSVESETADEQSGISSTTVAVSQ